MSGAQRLRGVVRQQRLSCEHLGSRLRLFHGGDETGGESAPTYRSDDEIEIEVHREKLLREPSISLDHEWIIVGARNVCGRKFASELGETLKAPLHFDVD